MTGFNPWIDVAVIVALFAAFGGIAYVGSRLEKKPVLRGATKI
jgi:hypothetical protein